MIGGVLVSDKQNINEKASEDLVDGEILIVPVLTDESVDGLEIRISTSQQPDIQVPVSSFSIRLKYPGDIRNKITSGEDGPFRLTDAMQENWALPVNEVNFVDGVTNIDVSAVYTGPEGYSSSQQTNIAELDFNEGLFTRDDYSQLGWDEEHTKMMTKTLPIENILRTIDKQQIK